MSVVWGLTAAIEQLGATAAAIITNGNGETAHIANVVLCNTDSAARTFKLYHVPNNGGAVGTAEDEDLLFDDYSIDANDTLIINDLHIILDDTNDTLQGLASVAAKVTVRCYGWVVS